MSNPHTWHAHHVPPLGIRVRPGRVQSRTRRRLAAAARTCSQPGRGQAHHAL